MDQRKSHRIQSIDILRGVVMILMALDHSREYFHSSGFANGGSPTDLDKLSLYLNNWVSMNP